jgi:hypothetical protein
VGREQPSEHREQIVSTMLKGNARRSLWRRAITAAAILGLVTPATVATLAVIAPPAAATQFDISTIAGTGTNGYNGDSKDATTAQLNNATGVTTDAFGNVVLADRTNHRIRVVARDSSNPGYPCGGCTWTPGDIYTVAGTGTGGFNGDGGTPATSLRLNSPADVAVDSSGNILIADQSNNRVRVLSVSPTNPGYPCGGCAWTSGTLYTVAGIGTANYNGDDIVASSAELRGPGNVAFDGQGNLLIGDTVNGRIRVVAVSAMNPGYALGGSGCPCGWTQQHIFTIAGSSSTGFGGDGAAATSALLNNPHGVTTDAGGNVLIADSSNNRIRVVEVSASNPGYPCGACAWSPGKIETIAGTGTSGYNNDDIVSNMAWLSAPNDVRVDSNGNVLIADLLNARVRIIAVGADSGYPLWGCGGSCGVWNPGHIFTIVGTGTSAYNGDGITAGAATLSLPADLDFDPNGELLIADQGNYRIRSVQVFAPINFLVPAVAADPNGFDTGLTVDNNISLSATGMWSEQTGTCSLCRTPNGIPPSGPQTNFLAPALPAYSLVGRIGTIGPWSEIGTGRNTLFGMGELYLAMNDVTGGYADNDGSLTVSVETYLHVDSSYDTSGPVLANGTIDYQGTLKNNGTFGLEHSFIWVNPATELTTADVSVPTWQAFNASNVAVGSPADCDLLVGSTPLYECSVGEIFSGYSIVVNAQVDAGGVEPQSITDSFFLERSDRTRACYLGCTPPHGNQQTQRVDGVKFNVSAPSTVRAGLPLTIGGTFANTSATETINGINMVGTIDRGHYTSSDVSCALHNNAGPGGHLDCPANTGSTYGFAPGGDAPLTATIDTTGLGGQTIHYTFHVTSPDLGGSSYTYSNTVVVITQASANVPANTPPLSTQITAGSNAGWVVTINNSSGLAAQDVSLTLDATAVEPDSETSALSFDQAAINRALGLDANAPTCSPPSGPVITCTLPDDIPAHTIKKFTVLALTDGLPAGTTITGHVAMTSPNALDSSGNLGTVTVVNCAGDCTIGVAVPGDPFESEPGPPTPADPTKQVLLLTSNDPGGTLPALKVTLQSIDPEDATDPGDAKLCPTASGQTHCSGQISSVIAQTATYLDKKNPIRVTVIARWGDSVPAGRILMEKNTGGDPIFLNACEVNAATREFNTPCALPQIVRGSAATHNLTTYTTILFVGDDIHFARRTADGGTVIHPPGAPTAVTATTGSSRATVKWKAPTATNGAGVSGYTVTVLSGGVVQKTATFNNAVLTQTITGLTPGKTYTFKVAAKNVAGAGTASAPSNAIKPTGPPAAPTGLTATAGAAKATLRWTAPASNNGAAVNGYVVTVLIAGVVQKTVVFNSTAVTQVVTGLTRGKSYTFKVAARNALGTGPPSGLSNAVKPT